ncbi:MAG: YvrJ family protein [Deltaproteobacteria bacterium]|nr:YvrJ family protein [Deltaproteobacteria bacterium]
MDLKTVGDFIGSVGFPAFVAIFVLIRLEPAITRLRQSITSLMVVTAKSNGMKGEDVAEIVRLVADRSHRRRIEDQVDGVDMKDKKD